MSKNQYFDTYRKINQVEEIPLRQKGNGLNFSNFNSLDKKIGIHSKTRNAINMKGYTEYQCKRYAASGTQSKYLNILEGSNDFIDKKIFMKKPSVSNYKLRKSIPLEQLKECSEESENIDPKMFSNKEPTIKEINYLLNQINLELKYIGNMISGSNSISMNQLTLPTLDINSIEIYFNNLLNYIKLISEKLTEFLNQAKNSDRLLVQSKINLSKEVEKTKKIIEDKESIEMRISKRFLQNLKIIENKITKNQEGELYDCTNLPLGTLINEKLIFLFENCQIKKFEESFQNTEENNEINKNHSRQNSEIPVDINIDSVHKLMIENNSLKHQIEDLDLKIKITKDKVLREIVKVENEYKKTSTISKQHFKFIKSILSIS